MATTLGQVSATIALDVSRWRRGANQAAASNRKLERSMARMGRNIDRQTRTLGNAARGLRTIALVGVAASGVLAAMARRAIQATDELSKMSRRIDTSVELLQALQFAAASYNISQSQMTRGFIKFRSELAAIKSGTYSEAETYIRDLDAGLLSLLVSTESTEDAFRKLLNALSGADTDKALAILNLLFSKRAGASILQVVSEAPRGLDTYIDRVKELGGLTSEQAFLLEDVNQKFTDLGFAFGNSLKKAIVDNREAVKNMLDSLTRLAVDVAPKLVDLFGALVKASEKIAENARPIVGVIGAYFAGKIGGNVGGGLGGLIGRRGAAYGKFFGSAAAGVGGYFAATRAYDNFNRRKLPGGATVDSNGVITFQPPRIVQAHTGTPTNTQLFGADTAANIATIADRLSSNFELLERGGRRRLEDLRGLTPRQEAQRSVADLLESMRKPFEDLRAELQRSGGTPTQIGRLDQVIADLDLSKYDEWIEKLTEGNQKIKDFQTEQARVSELAGGIANAFEQGLDILIQTGDFAKGLRSILGGIISQIIRTQLISPIATNFGDFVSGFFGGEKALGGPVIGGAAYLVGETGPEFFRPNSSGRIVSNSEIRNYGGGSGQVVFNLINTGGDKEVDHTQTNIDLERGIADVFIKDLRDKGDIYTYMESTFDIKGRN